MTLGVIVLRKSGTYSMDLGTIVALWDHGSN